MFPKIFALCVVAALPFVALAVHAVSPNDMAQSANSEFTAAARIVTLAPNITELVYAAGAGNKLVGVARFSDYPPAAKYLPIVGDFSGIDFERVLSLTPDLVIAWTSGNRASDVNKLRALGLRVVLLEPSRLQDISESLREIGKLAATEPEATLAADRFERAIVALGKNSSRGVKVFYQIWNAPLITVNHDHIISDIVTRCGGNNIFVDAPSLTTVVSRESVLMADPDVILISNSSLQNGLEMWSHYPSIRAVVAKKIYEVPPDLIQRHSPRIIRGAQVICQILAQVESRAQEAL